MSLTVIRPVVIDSIVTTIAARLVDRKAGVGRKARAGAEQEDLKRGQARKFQEGPLVE